MNSSRIPRPVAALHGAAHACSWSACTAACSSSRRTSRRSGTDTLGSILRVMQKVGLRRPRAAALQLEETGRPRLRLPGHGPAEGRPLGGRDSTPSRVRTGPALTVLDPMSGEEQATPVSRGAVRRRLERRADLCKRAQRLSDEGQPFGLRWSPARTAAPQAPVPGRRGEPRPCRR